MMQRVILLFVMVFFVVTIPAEAFAQDDPPPMDCIPRDNYPMSALDMTYLVSGLLLTGANFGLIAYNSEKLRAGEPDGSGAMGGIMFGMLGLGLGTVIIFSEEPSVRFVGAGCILGGAVSLVYGFRGASAYGRMQEGNQKQGFNLEPVLIKDGRGKLGPGLQVSWLF